MQELGSEVGTVGPLDGVAREAVLRELVEVEQLAERSRTLSRAKISNYFQLSHDYAVKDAKSGRRCVEGSWGQAPDPVLGQRRVMGTGT